MLFFQAKLEKIIVLVAISVSRVNANLLIFNKDLGARPRFQISSKIQFLVVLFMPR